MEMHLFLKGNILIFWGCNEENIGKERSEIKSLNHFKAFYH